MAAFLPFLPKSDGSPVVTESLMRPHHGQQIRCVCDWSGHDVDDVSMLEDRNHLHGHFHMLHDAVQVRFEQLLTET